VWSPRLLRSPRLLFIPLSLLSLIDLREPLGDLLSLRLPSPRLSRGVPTAPQLQG
jgi:hypothetical protein